MISPRIIGVLLLCGLAAGSIQEAANLRTETFDAEPAWEGHNNRATEPALRRVRQDFGYRSHRIGGFITPDGQPAYYAKRLRTLTLATPYSASGTFVAASGKFHVLLGFFNHRTLNEWRTPNSVVLRLQGRGDHFFAYLEYCTSRWRAGGDSPRGFTVARPGGREEMRRFELAPASHTWSIRYDPAAREGRGVLYAAIDGQTAECDLGEGHREDGATFDRFGLLNVVKSADDTGEIYLADVEVNGKREELAADPGWEGRGNHREYDSPYVRPRFDFGWSRTRFAGGRGIGEIGGEVYRGDGRYPARMAWYAAPLGRLDPSRPLHAEGRVALWRGVSDSTTLLGFFDSHASIAPSEDQAHSLPPSFLGISIEGPSGEGFYLYPSCRLGSDQTARNRGADLARILPDGRSHRWMLDYHPAKAAQEAEILLAVDGSNVRLALPPGSVDPATMFDHFGIVTTRIDGNGQRVYFDDLAFTGGSRP